MGIKLARDEICQIRFHLHKLARERSFDSNNLDCSLPKISKKRHWSLLNLSAVSKLKSM